MITVDDWIGEIEHALWGKRDNTFERNQLDRLRLVVERILAAADGAGSAPPDRLDLEQAARLLRSWAGDRQRASGKWTMQEQVAVDLAIRLEAAAQRTPAGLPAPPEE